MRANDHIFFALLSIDLLALRTPGTVSNVEERTTGEPKILLNHLISHLLRKDVWDLVNALRFFFEMLLTLSW